MRKANNWTDQDDNLLLELHPTANCFQRWKYISEELRQKGVFRTEIECRERFVNKLNPELRRDKLEPHELRALFTYYDQYGSLWSVFQSLIPGRNQNLLKNKFYSTLRSFVRLICLAAAKKTQNPENFNTASLSSKLLVEIYEGKKNFRKFKSFVRKLFRKLEFQPQQEKIDLVQAIFGQELLFKIWEEINGACKGPKTNSKRIRGSSLKTQPILADQQSVQDPSKKSTPNEQASGQLKIEEKRAPESQPTEWAPQVGVYCPVMNPLQFFFPIWAIDCTGFPSFKN